MNATRPFTVRPARPADLTDLLALEQASFSADRLSPRQYRRHLRSASACLLVAEGAREDIAGALLLLFRRGTRVARLYSLATAPDWRGQGVARQLLARADAEAMTRDCTRLRLEVRSDNQAAIALYRQMGFTPIGHYRQYYQDGCDAVRMQKALPNMA